MAPSKKFKSLPKRFSSIDEVSPDNNYGDSSKGRQRKRKLSDMLGSQWSKEELERFYEAYRKYGKDWKKVAAIVRNRSIEMVEALYKMNQAYLSLPEGTASVVGLKAMMTDHYNVLGGSDSERESNGGSGISRKRQKRGQGEVRLSTSKEHLLQSQSVASNDDCLSLLKRRHTDGCAVGKRTPRFPVSYLYKKHDGGVFGSPTQKGWKSRTDANDDAVAHAALALTEASQRVSSPQISQMPYRRTAHMKHSPAQSRKGKHSQSGMVQAKLYAPVTDEDYSEDNLGSGDAENGDDVRDTGSLMHLEGVGTVEVHRRGKKFYGQRGNVEDVANTHFDDGREACSGTEGGLDISAIKKSFDLEVTNVKSERPSPQGQRKRSKKQLVGDEASAFDALKALADLSLIASTVESESSIQIKDEKATFDVSDKVIAPEAMSPSHQRDKSKQLWGKTIHPISGADISTPRKSKPTRDSESDAIDATEAKLRSQSASKALKRKHMSSLTKVIAEEENKPVTKTKHGGQNSASSKQWKSVRSPDRSLSSSDQRSARTDMAASTADCTATNQVSLSTKQRSRRKMDPHRVLTSNQIKALEKNGKDQIAKHAASLRDTVEQLSCYLSSPMVRRWCTFEWFYSVIDYPWFAKREFVEYLNHVGLGHIPRLTRVEWGVIRSSLGKPRRFSEHFLFEEKMKLKQYRESVRLHYAELRSGVQDGLPTDLARPLSVGQRVVALHPKTREVHDGSVLTVDQDKCRVQFDHPQMGVEFVMDIDCMPLLPLESIPEAIKSQNASVEKLYVNSREPRMNGQSNTEGSTLFAPSENPENTHYLSSSNHSANTFIKQAQGDTVCAISQAKARAVDIVNAQAAYSQPCAVTQVQAREADVRALSELAHTLDKKEALLMELRHTNNDVLEGQSNVDSNLKNSEQFKKHYATVLVQLKEASDQVSSAVLCSRQRNTYPGKPLPVWSKQPAVSNGLSGPPSHVDNLSSNSPEAGLDVIEIVKGSKSKASSMVDAAFQAMSSIKEGDDAFARISEALDSLHRQQISSDSGLPLGRSPDPINNSLADDNHLNSFTSEPLLTGHASDSKVNINSDNGEAQVPSELITSCVATLLIMQMCTERQYPPADVAQILDSAVTSLHPCCPQNLPIYREIQMCMGRIKTQILALIPT